MISMQEAAKICDVSPKIREKVAIELQASYPFPIRESGKIFLKAFYSAMFGPPPSESYALYPPRWIVTLSSDDGSIIDLRKEPPEYFGITGRPDQPFAQFAFTHDWSLEELEENLSVFFQTYDVLVRQWSQSPSSDASKTDSEEKKLFRNLFDKLSPTPLLRCYLKLGQDFFTWVGY